MVQTRRGRINVPVNGFHLVSAIGSDAGGGRCCYLRDVRYAVYARQLSRSHSRIAPDWSVIGKLLSPLVDPVRAATYYSQEMYEALSREIVPNAVRTPHNHKQRYVYLSRPGDQSMCSLRIAVAALMLSALLACKAAPPSHAEKKIAQESKELIVGGRDSPNPVPDDALARKKGSEQFQQHCGVCHGLDGQNTGVSFAQNMSPPVPSLATPDIQKYTDGQLKWIIQNGIRMSGMPGWHGLLDDEQMWQLVRYIRHLPQRSSG